MTNLTLDELICGRGATPAALVATVASGDTISVLWSGYPDDRDGNWIHDVGPLLTYLAACDTACTMFNATQETRWFKISEKGTQSNGNWMQEQLCKISWAQYRHSHHSHNVHRQRIAGQCDDSRNSQGGELSSTARGHSAPHGPIVGRCRAVSRLRPAHGDRQRHDRAHWEQIRQLPWRVQAEGPGNPCRRTLSGSPRPSRHAHSPVAGIYQFSRRQVPVSRSAGGGICVVSHVVRPFDIKFT